MATTFTKIASVTVGANSPATIDFTSIPQTFTDLMLYTSIRSSRSSANQDQLLYRFNGSAAGVRFLTLEGRPATPTIVSFTDTTVMYAGANPASTATASVYGNCCIYITNYTGSGYKTSSVDLVSEFNATGPYQTIGTNLWSSTSPVNSINLYLETAGSTFVQYSTATLYGILNS